ncbi:MAG: DUF624 domain-containing protein [Erysipelotrichaceae bacterium]|nr:DUF624 domain-containing protein [Erysipelotrichaceae bacterium]
MNYNSPFIKILETLANMVIVSILWLVFSLPAVTIVPASAALFHTVNKIIFGPGKGNGVFKDFYASFKENLREGAILSIIVIIAVLVILEGLWTGYQFHKVSLWGMAYMMLGIVIAFFFIIALIHIAPVLSRFDAPVLSIIRMAVYFAMRKPIRSIFFCILFVAMLFCVQAFPLALLIVPAIYTDFLRGPLDKDFRAFIKENGLSEENEETETEEAEDQTEKTPEEESITDLDERFSKERK